MTEVIAAYVALGLSVAAIATTFFVWWLGEQRAKVERYVKWTKELADSSDMYQIDLFKRKCEALGVHYAAVYHAHEPLTRLVGDQLITVITEEDLAKVERAKSKLAYVFDVVQWQLEENLLNKKIMKAKVVIKEALNYLELVECTAAATWYRNGNQGDYVQQPGSIGNYENGWNEFRPGRYTWIQTNFSDWTEAKTESHKNTCKRMKDVANRVKEWRENNQGLLLLDVLREFDEQLMNINGHANIEIV